MSELSCVCKARDPEPHRSVLGSEWWQIWLGLAALAVGVLVYVLDRPSGLTALPESLTLFRPTVTVFGAVGQSLPAFAHVFAFSLLTVALLGGGHRTAIAACGGWFLVDTVFELGQHPAIGTELARLIPPWFEAIPILNRTDDFFRSGTFDAFDLVAMVLGALAAYFVMQRTGQRRTYYKGELMMSKRCAAQAVHRLAVGIVIVFGFLSILATGGGGGDGNPTFTVGGTVSGLAGSGLVLQNNGGDDLGISGDGAFTFAAALANGSAYNVTVLTQPTNPVQNCTVTNGSGTLSGANITNVSVDCTNLSGGDQNVTVTCGSDTIAAALANAVPGGRLTITVNGTCTENVTIERDRVTLKDGTVAGTGAVQPVIQILGARGIVIDNMTVQGGASDGIFATHNADVTITDSTVRNNAQDGVDLRWGAFGDISGSTISGNPNCAVVVADGANVLLTNNPLITTAQPSSGVCATIGAYRKTTTFLNGGNTITNSSVGGHVLDILDSSALRATNGVDVITGVIGVSRTANVDLRNATVTGDIGVTRNAWLGVRPPSSVTGNIFIASDSTATFLNTPTIDGTVTCGNSAATLVDSTAVPGPMPVTVTGSGDLARVREGRAAGSIAVGSFNNCNF